MFYEIVKKLCCERKIGITTLATDLKISKSNVTNWKNGSIPKSDKLELIAKYFNVSTDYLLGREEQALPSNMRYVDISSRVNVPMYGNVSAGLGAYTDNQIECYEAFDASSIRPGHNYISLRVDGDSMYPMLVEGDMVLVQLESSVDSESYAVVLIDGEEGVIKKVVYDKNSVELHSINPMYKVRRFEGEELERLRVIGLVVESKRKY